MRFLLDTHALLWWLFDDPKLPETMRSKIAQRDNEILVSSASAWEISTKFRLGKLPAAEPLAKDFLGYVRKAGFNELAVSIPHAQLAGSWPQTHRDPFDRMLAAQSQLEKAPMISRDAMLLDFGIEVLW